MNSNIENLKNEIETLNKKSHYLAIFKIIYDNNCKYIHNEDGVFINLNFIDSETIKKIQNKIDEIKCRYQVIKPDDVVLNKNHISKYNGFNIYEKRMLNQLKLDID
jgi:hypothetical protein